jgi:hypothetical protein
VKTTYVHNVGLVLSPMLGLYTILDIPLSVSINDLHLLTMQICVNL